ncbi:hypothetical protein [Companilactobacillus nuruki]|uniref:Uncharacterized protein n=1 Tax=Companilactobacillus nuruki TaxID=1993540 RepID=A0A2N7AWC4_9LACO|nr:hypothetical protein [Companilactobacillus nuruki]PMD73055.1 hypothetical protein CBP76_02675 [Companilactobacillus nuruki]
MNLDLLKIMTTVQPLNWTDWTPIVISTMSLIIAIGSAVLSLISYLHGKPNLVLEQAHRGKTSVVIEPEWNDKDENNPDIYSNRRYRVIIEVTLKNKSSNPISISSFKLNSLYEYNQYTQPGSEYSVEVRRSIHKLPYGITAGGRGRMESFPISEKWIKPIVTIKPYGIVQGYLFWPIYDEDLKNINIKKNNTISVNTTFGNFDFNVKLSELITRDKELKGREAWSKRIEP